MRLILGGVLDRYPDLVIVLGHLGKGISYWLHRIDNRHAFIQRTIGDAMGMSRLQLTPGE